MSEAEPDTFDERYIHQFQPEPSQSVSQSVNQSVSQSVSQLLELQSFVYQRILKGFCKLLFFTNLSRIGFQFRYFNLFLPFSVIDSFEWIWMRSLDRNTQLMLEFLKAPFLVATWNCQTSQKDEFVGLLVLHLLLLLNPCLIVEMWPA